MKRLVYFETIIVLIFLAGCVNEKDQNSTDVLSKEWSQIEKSGEGQTVHLFMWGGDEGINKYFDDYVIPELKDRYAINLERHPMDTADFIAKLQTEKQAGKTKGTMDIIWINGESFRKAKQNELLLGDFATKLPNLKNYIGIEEPFVKFDTGTAIEGEEAPWGKVQFTFIYDEARVKNPPQSFKELIEWVKANPNRFTYPNVKDFTGNAFIRQLMYSVAKDPGMISGEFNESWINGNGQKVWNKLNEMKPYLWRNGETHPDSLAQLDKMYANGQVDFTMGFNEKRIKSLIKDGVFPPSTKTLVFDSGSIGNTHYLSIPFNSSNPAAAMTAINFMLSPEAQMKKMEPHMWGEGSVLNQEKLTNEQLRRFKKIWGRSIVPSDAVLSDLDTEYADWIKENWENEVVKN
ncbi:ABC transporter substrate-binding protein [Salinicoccus albus]|uniref:ABC transporter substrate-binding protein n=1 Tax=Salinicoccus albus TaxID=418756 RepID=UPI00036D3111|nr:ABC transporter substrate-binding protein [Salinicoccus albus]